MLNPVSMKLLILCVMQIEDRLLNDYQVLNELVTPLRDVVNYEAHTGNDSDTYHKLALAGGQLNSSLEEIQNIVSISLLYILWTLATSGSCFSAK